MLSSIIKSEIIISLYKYIWRIKRKQNQKLYPTSSKIHLLENYRWFSQVPSLLDIKTICEKEVNTSDPEIAKAIKEYHEAHYLAVNVGKDKV